MPIGTDVAFAMPGTGKEASNLTYWDVWFALVADADFGGSLDQLAAHMKEKNRRSVTERGPATAGNRSRDTKPDGLVGLRLPRSGQRINRTNAPLSDSIHWKLITAAAL